LEVNWQFGGTYRSACVLFSRWFLALLVLLPRRWRRCVPPKCQLAFNGLHGVISKKIVLFITTAMRTQISMKYCVIRFISVHSICMFILMNLNTYVIVFYVADIPTFRLRSPVMAYCMCTYFIKVFTAYKVLYTQVLPKIVQNDDFVSVVVSFVFLIGSFSCTFIPILIWLDIHRFVMYMKKWLQFQVPHNCVIIIICVWDRLSEMKQTIAKHHATVV
jgi:hypothetical protein